MAKKGRAKAKKRNGKKPGKKGGVLTTFRKLGAAALTGLSPMMGEFAPIGAALGTLLGSGAYRMNTLANSLVQSESGLSVQVPYMHSNNDTFKLRHREYLRDISSTTDFTLASYPINPGVASSFPWLSSIALNFTEYRFTGLAYEFKSTSADALNSTNTALGTVIMAPKYNLEAAEFVSKMEMEAQMGAVSCKPAQSMVCLVECAPSENVFAKQFVRTGEEIQASLLYDLGEMTLATVGSQASAVIGELWVTYEIELSKPKFGAGALLQNGLWYNSWTPTSDSNITPIGTALDRTVVHDNFPGQGVTIPADGSGDRVIYLPPHIVGAYLLVIEWDGLGVGFVAPSHTLSSGLETNIDPFWVTAGPIYYFNAPNSSGPTGVTHAVKLVMFRVIDFDVENTITIGTSGVAPETARCTINIWQVHDPSVDPAITHMSYRQKRDLSEKRKMRDLIHEIMGVRITDAVPHPSHATDPDFDYDGGEIEEALRMHERREARRLALQSASTPIIRGPKTS